MDKKYKLSLFVFRRDLRLEDNTGLISALKNSELVLPCFILDPRQCKNNPYKNAHLLQFMAESILDLQQQFAKIKSRLFIFNGISEKIIAKIIKHKKINAVFINRDYTPFSLKRDEHIAKVCEFYKIDFHSFDDTLLNPPERTLKSDGTAYKVFTSFYNYCRKFPIAHPVKNHYTNYYSNSISFSKSDSFLKKYLSFNPTNDQAGGRTICLKKLSQLKKIHQYSKDHNYPSKQATSGLSPHLKFSTCSVREVYYSVQSRVKDSGAMIRELYWRDFFTMIAFYFPTIFKHAYRKKYQNLEWDNDPKKFNAWCLGKTGFPIVDAGMRQLNQTGTMHNRVRLIVASFLVKDLHIDWRWGELYFAKQLTDYDPAVNNGNWQWVAGTGTDAQPYFRVFNPWLQQKKYDTDCVYIKKWIPELINVENKIIHTWYDDKYNKFIHKYLRPIVNHNAEVSKAKKIYSKV